MLSLILWSFGTTKNQTKKQTVWSTLCLKESSHKICWKNMQWQWAQFFVSLASLVDRLHWNSIWQFLFQSLAEEFEKRNTWKWCKTVAINECDENLTKGTYDSAGTVRIKHNSPPTKKYVIDFLVNMKFVHLAKMCGCSGILATFAFSRAECTRVHTVVNTSIHGVIGWQRCNGGAAKIV